LNLTNQSAEALADDELARNGATATDLQGDRKILVAGGQNNNGAWVDLGALFNPAKVWTDYDDYPPGTPVGIKANGFLPGESVTLQVLHTDGTNDNTSSTAHDSWEVTADANGDFSTIWNIPADEDELGATLEVTATGQSSRLSAKATFTDAVNISISASDATAAESGSPASNTGTFTVSRPGGAVNDGAVTVTYSISGTAGNGTDYATLSGSVTIPNGSASVDIVVQPVDDALVEDIETVTLTLTGFSGSPPSGYQISSSPNT